MHIQVFVVYAIFAVCILSLFTLVKNGSIGHCMGLLLWEEDDGGDTQATQLVVKCPQPHNYYGLDRFVCLYVARQHLQVDGPKTSPSLTLTVEHILLKCCPHVLGKLLPCVHHTCTRVRIDIYIPLLACAYICMDAYTNCALQWKHVILGEKLISC